MSIKPVAAAALVSLVASLPAAATMVTIDFETPTSFAPIDTHYAGGTDDAGVAGANLGVSFGLDVLALHNDAVGPYFSNAPSPLGVMIVVGAAAFMNVVDGFVALSLSYSSDSTLTDALDIWSGLDGTGTKLGSLSLTANAQADGCTDSPFCNFDTLSAGGFGMRGYSVTFGNAANVAVFDDVLLAVPEPATALLVGLGLIGVAASRRRG